MRKILVTGSAGFIGSYVAGALVARGFDVVGLDCVNDYYDPELKWDRLSLLGIEPKQAADRKLTTSRTHPNYRFLRTGVEDTDRLAELFRSERFDTVCHLAAQAGVRYSIENPAAYEESNLKGFLNILECCRHNRVAHLVYASSSSVYGSRSRIPFREDEPADYPLSFYAATKRANELMAYSYANLYGIAATGLRFFTVYGPWGRPDMALMLFADAITEGRALKLFNGGDMSRDFTYIDDICEGVLRVMERPATGLDNDPTPYKVYNIGASRPIPIRSLVALLEENLGKSARIENMPMQPGDVPTTYADTSRLRSDFGYSPSTTLEEGVAKFAEWYVRYYHKV